MAGIGMEKLCMLKRAAGAQDKTVNIDRIMLRFRPIAPKPVAGGTASGNSRADDKNVLVNNKRSKRKYVRVRKNNNGYRRKNKTIEVHGSKDGTVNKIVTLQLLPEREDSEDPTRRTSRCNYLDKTGEDKVVSGDKEQLTWLNLNNQVFDNMVVLGVSDQSQTAVVPERMAVETLVTVESVTSDTCNMGSRGVGSADAEIMMKLERDTCPAFISDGLNRVHWVNGAYKRMVMVSLEKERQSESSEAVTVEVRLAMKDNKIKYLASQLSSLFTCKVRVEYMWQKEKYSKMVPCDVWRLMEFGGFAWRLDVEAALSLGR